MGRNPVLFYARVLKAWTYSLVHGVLLTLSYWKRTLGQNEVVVAGHQLKEKARDSRIWSCTATAY
jgi:hypothetical protein